MSKLGGIAILVSLLSGGCTMIPKYERPAPPVAPEFPTATAPQTEPEGSEVEWRDFFGDERLKKLIELALANNRDMRVAILNVEQSRAQYRVTRSASYPSVNASGSYTRSALSLTGFPQAGEEPRLRPPLFRTSGVRALALLRMNWISGGAFAA